MISIVFCWVVVWGIWIPAWAKSMVLFVVEAHISNIKWGCQFAQVMRPLQFCGAGLRVDQHQTWTIQASFCRSSCQVFDVCPVRGPVTCSIDI